MITAREALALPSARISASDSEAADAVLVELDAWVREKMSRAMDMSQVSCAMPVDPKRLNPVILCEIGGRLRRAGWVMAFAALQTHSVVTNRMEITGYQIRLTPSEKTFDDEALL